MTNFSEPLPKSKMIRQTERAVLINWCESFGRFEGEHINVEHWFPKSQCEQNEYGVWCVPQWLYDNVYAETVSPALESYIG